MRGLGFVMSHTLYVGTYVNERWYLNSPVTRVAACYEFELGRCEPLGMLALGCDHEPGTVPRCHVCGHRASPRWTIKLSNLALVAYCLSPKTLKIVV
jgi:hypothetical protein